MLGRQSYHDTSKSEWLAQSATYLTKALSSLKTWCRRCARWLCTATKGYFVLGPEFLGAGHVVCILFGGKMPFCLRSWEHHYLLVGECYMYGMMRREAMEMLSRRPAKFTDGQMLTALDRGRPLAQHSKPSWHYFQIITFPVSVDENGSVSLTNTLWKALLLRSQ